jgi:hypothetical protein
MPPFEVQGRGLSGSLSLVARHSPLVHLEVEMEAYLRLGFWSPQRSWLPSNISGTFELSVYSPLGTVPPALLYSYCCYLMYSLYRHNIMHYTLYFI